MSIQISGKRWKVFLTIFFSLFCAALYYLAAAVLFLRPIYIFALPVVFILFILFFINDRALLAGIIFTRALLDAPLAGTRSEVSGLNTGLGGILNLLVIFLGIKLLRSGSQDSGGRRFRNSWLAFLLICGLTVYYTPVRPEAVKLWLNLLTYAVMFFIPFFIVKNKSDVTFWVKVLLFASIMAVAASCFDLVKGGAIYGGEKRIAGTFSHPNMLAFYLVYVIVLVFFILKSRILALTGNKRFFLGLYMLFVLGVLLATKTRSAWVSCWIFFFFYGVFKERKYLAAALLLPPLFLFFPPIQARVQDLMQNTGSNLYGGLNSWAWRLELWKRSFIQVKESPWFGYGLSSFPSYSINFFPAEAGGRGVPAHNAILQLAFETGAFGLFSYLAIFFKASKAGLRGFRRSSGAVSSAYLIAAIYCLAYLLSCLGDNMLYYLSYNWYFFFFIGVLLRMGQISHEKNIGHHPVV